MSRRPALTRTPGDAEQALFIIACVFLGIGLLLAGALKLWPGLSRYLRLPGKCGWEAATGLPCPGCGGTRAVRALLQGKLADAFYYHAAVPLSAMGLIAFAVLYLANRLSRGRLRCIAYRDLYLYLILALCLLQWFVKLGYQWVTGSSWL